MSIHHDGNGKTIGLVLFTALAITTAFPSSAGDSVARPYDKTFVTHHTEVFGKKTLKYTATVKSTVLADGSGASIANFVSTDYVLDGVSDPSKRPVIFAWAGGPSVASVGYHTHMLGPRRIIDPEPGHEGENEKIINNPDWLLDVADIVLVDPAETGFSRILPGGKREYFYSVNGDTATIEQFMDRWLKDRNRENSPRYVMGGSYGSVRVIRIAYDLRNSPHPVDGMILTANCAMLQEMNGPIGYAAALPSLEMTAIYHGKADRGGMSDAQIIDDAYRFAMYQYLPALSTVQDLTPQERSAMVAQLSARTGISADVFSLNNLAIGTSLFMNTLLKEQGLVIAATSDGRLTRRIDATAEREAVPNLYLQYMKVDLKVTYPMDDYHPSAPNTGSWNYDGPKDAKRADGGNDWPKMLHETMETDQKIRMFSANGYYDNQCPYGQARYLFSRTKLPRERIVVREYPGPHGLYWVPATAHLIADDIRKMIADQGH